jgi:hypothetical protein
MGRPRSGIGEQNLRLLIPGENMAKNFDTMEDSNRSANADIHTVSDPARRLW